MCMCVYMYKYMYMYMYMCMYVCMYVCVCVMSEMPYVPLGGDFGAAGKNRCPKRKVVSRLA